LVDLVEALVVGAPNDVARRGARPIDAALNWQAHVHIVKHDQMLAAFQIRLHGLVLIHRTRQAKR
jgi:hypothetical protein